MRLLISGGGTGGHIYPGLALANALTKKNINCEITFVGSKGGMEADIVPRAGYSLETIDLDGLPRKLSLQLISSVYKSFTGLFTARKLIKSFNPDLVIGTGGYVSGPLLLTASLYKIPTIIHEQNAYPGLTNKLLASVVDKVALTSKVSEKYFKDKSKLILTGNPIRPEILTKNKREAFKELGFDRRKKLVLIFGGSRGAASINNSALEIYEKFNNSDIQILHVTGKRDFSKIEKLAHQKGIKDLEKGNIVIKPYLYQMDAGLAAADLVVCRAGATALAEITACGIPAVLIPYPYAAENHQEHNARALEEHGAAEVILDDELTGEILVETIKGLINNTAKLNNMASASKSLGKPKATENLLKLVEELV